MDNFKVQSRIYLGERSLAIVTGGAPREERTEKVIEVVSFHHLSEEDMGVKGERGEVISPWIVWFLVRRG